MAKRRQKKREGSAVGLADYLHELGVLKRVRRSGWWLAGVRDAESVAEHSFRVAAVAYFLAEMEGADPGKTVAMAVFHDAAEARVNDLHRLGKRYARWSGVEERVVADQTRRFPAALRAKLRRLLAEERRQESVEARVAKDADSIECLLQAREYAEQGYAAREWIESSVRELRTASAKRLARAVLRTRPSRWRGTSR